VPEGKEFEACGVCGRTILRGERVAEYVAPDGTRIGVCTLCKPAAESAGWVPAELARAGEHSAGARGRGLGLRKRLSRASEAARSLAARSARAPEQDAQEPPARRSQPPERESDEGRSHRGERAQADRDERSGSRPRSKPRPRSVQPPSPAMLLRRGLERFNASPEPRKVAGLIRTLGEPRVAVRMNPGGAVVVTVAWELSWYQWEVGADSNGEAIHEAGKGNEVSELALRDRNWNASASSDGTVTLKLVAAQQDSGERE
jgi:hypothetical protein